MTCEALMQLSPPNTLTPAFAEGKASMYTARPNYPVLTVALVFGLVTQSRIAFGDTLPPNHSTTLRSIFLLISLLAITVVALAILIVRDRRYAQHLAYSHHRLELATDANGVGIWDRDLRSNRLIWDDAMLRLYGVTRANFRGYTTWIESVHPDDRERAQAALQNALDGSSAYNVEFRIVLPDSSIRYIKALGEVIRNDHGTPIRVLGTNWDVTDQKLAEQELLNRRASDIELQEMLVTLHEVVNELSRAQTTDEFTHEAVFLAHTQLGFDRLGFWFYNEDLQSVRGSYGIDENGTIRDERAKSFVISPEKNPKDFELISGRAFIEYNDDIDLYDDNSVVVGRGQSIRASIWDGRKGLGFLSFDNLCSGVPITPIQREMARLYGSAVGHLFARRLADDALAESEERLKMAVEAANTGIWAWNTETNELYWSDTVCQIFGVGMGSAPKSYDDYLKLIYEEDRNDLVNAIQDMIKHGTKYKITHRIVRPEGSIRWVECYGHISRNANGNLARMAGTIVDISERKSMEDTLLQSSKLESIGRLAGGIAHDFNNMLAVIIGYAEIVQDKVAPDPDLARCMTNISTTAERAADLTSQLLAFARKQIVVSRVIDLNVVLHEAEAILDRLLPSHITLKPCPYATPVWINADPSQIQQIILNLALNARDAMPDTGLLTVSISTRSADEIVAIDTEHRLAPGTYATIIVRDTGTGIPEENRNKIFEPFFTTKPLGRGTGFGLATVYGIVKQNGGDIAVSSQINAGSEFTVYLPTAEPPEPTEAVVLTSTASSGSGTVLVAEDQDDIREMINRTLTSSGFDVLEAANGTEALKIARSHDGEIRLVLTDLIMPGMGGQELAAILSSEFPQTKVLMMTGYSDTAVEGPAQFLFKPFALSTLIDTVKQQLE